MYNLHSIHASRGSALVISMIFLLVLTIAGVTAMRFASLEERMAANSQTAAYTFQQVQSEIQSHIRYLGSVGGRKRLNDLNYPDKKGTAQRDDLPTDATEILASWGSAPDKAVKDIEKREVRYLKEGPCPGGDSINSFICIEFELEITSEEVNGARAVQAQGFTFKNNIAD